MEEMLSSSSSFSLTPSQVFVIRITMIIGSIASLSSTIFVFMIYWFFKENRTFIFELTMWFSCSVATYSISCLLPYDNTKEIIWCPIQSFLSNSSLLSQEIWCSILAYCGLVTIVQKSHLESFKRRYRIFFCIIAIVVPLALSLLILILKVYGDSDGFCWIDIYNDSEKKVLVFKLVLLFFSIDWFIIIINLYFIIRIALLYKAYPDLKNPIYSYIIWYPIVNSLFELIAVGHRLLTLLNLKHNSFAFSLIQTISDSFEGCIFMVIFLFSPKFKSSVAMFCSRICLRSSINQHSENMLNQSKEEVIDNNNNSIDLRR